MTAAEFNLRLDTYLGMAEMTREKLASHIVAEHLNAPWLSVIRNQPHPQQIGSAAAMIVHEINKEYKLSTREGARKARADGKWVDFYDLMKDLWNSAGYAFGDKGINNYSNQGRTFNRLVLEHRMHQYGGPRPILHYGFLDCRYENSVDGKLADENKTMLSEMEGLMQVKIIEVPYYGINDDLLRKLQQREIDFFGPIQVQPRLMFQNIHFSSWVNGVCSSLDEVHDKYAFAMPHDEPKLMEMINDTVKILGEWRQRRSMHEN